MVITRLIPAVCVFVSVLAAQPGQAAEGGLSFYLPGTIGDIALAQTPEPGLQVANTLFFQKGHVEAAVLQGRVNVDLDLFLFLNIVSATYTLEKPVLGGTYTFGAAIPFGSAELEATVTAPVLGTFAVDESTFNLSDTVLIPFQLNWNIDEFSFKFGLGIYAPTGAYDVNEPVNIGLNHWGFDTGMAATYFNLETGTEVSVAPGILFNTKNNATDYRTGAEFHLDFTVNQFLSKTFALGLRGYYYNQIGGDSGSGAVLGDFKGESFGLGPGFFWTPSFAKGRLAVLGKWIHDVHAENRLKSDYGTFTIAWTF